MKTRESGMPEAELWESFFDPPTILDRLQFATSTGNVVEFGCGYGTFSLEAAQRTKGRIYALDIDPKMVARSSNRATQAGLGNVEVIQRDFMEKGTGLPDSHADYAMLFNLLHAEQPDILLAEAWRVLRGGGILGVMHWNYDPTTPRGPNLAIRPRPEQCRDWAVATGFELLPPGIVDLPPFHYGMALRKPVL